MQKKRLLIIDTDNLFIDDFNDRLRDQFLEEYQADHIVPHPNRGKSSMFTECIDVITETKKTDLISAVFVDINLSNKETDNIGIELAKKIKHIYPDIPVFCVTDKHDGEQALIKFTEATLENLDGVLIKNYLTTTIFSASKLTKMLQNAHHRRRKKREDVDILIITVIEKEFKALCSIFGLDDPLPYPDYNFKGVRCWKTTVKQQIPPQKELSVVITMIGGPGNVLSSLFTSSLLQEINPSTAILCGIAAGIKEKCKLYSTVIADAVAYYELQKLHHDGKITYRIDAQPAPSLISKDIPYIMLRSAEWKQLFVEKFASKIDPSDFSGKDWIDQQWIDDISLSPGVIATGEKLLADEITLNHLRDVIQINKGVVAGEMEAAGFCKACNENEVSNYLIFRGISDYGGPEKSDPIIEKHQILAAQSAGISVKEYLEHVYKIESRNS